jgi:LEA14-like dessication related protein
MLHRRRALLWMPFAALLPACAVMPDRDPVQVLVVGVESMKGEGLVLRFLCKLRIQNPNDTPIEYDGVYVELEVRDTTLASGVSDVAGTVPRFGEVVLAIPVTVSALRAVRLGLNFYMSSDRSMVDYVLKGKVAGPGFSAVRFESRGELKLPTNSTASGKSPP